MAIDHDAPDSPRRRPRSRAGIALACGLALLVTLFALSEIFLPSLAERRLRDNLSATGQGITVHLSSEPAFKLLFGRADRVRIHIDELRSGRGHLSALLARTARTERLDATVDTMITHGLRVDHVVLRKRGKALTASATVTRAAIDSALPAAIQVDEQQAGSSTLAFTATAHALGRSIHETVLVRAQDGRLLLEPSSVLGGLLRITLFGDPRVSVDAIRSVRRHSRYRFTARGHLT
jgi:hypothetical protein